MTTWFRQKTRKILAGALSVMMAITAAPSVAFANQPEQVVPHLGTARKQQYVLSASADNNALQINGSNITLNGNMYTPTNMNPYFGKVDVRGKAEFGGELLGREYANFTSYIYKDHAPKRELIDFSDTVMDSLGENPVIHEWWQTYSGTDVTNDGPIHAKSGFQFSGSNVELNGTVVSDSYMMVSASRAFTTPEGGEVNLYVPNGNIGIYGGDIDIDAVIYAPNGTVQISGSNIRIDGVIIAKEIQISGQDIVLNQNLDLSLAPFIEYYNEALWLMAECAYSTETEFFTLDWQSTFEEGTLDIYTSADDVNYALKGTVQDTDTYAFSIDNPVDNLYIKVVQTLDNGVFKESNTIRMAYDEESGYVMAVDDDTDGDGLTDIYEHFLETDKRNPDTDGDGLSDGEEVYLTDTDPLYRDSDEDTIPDGGEDPDFDGLTNLQEIQYGTDPQNPDSDGDALSDYDEIFIYGTDPLKPDTDGDGIDDGDEIALGLNPLLPDSDGDGIPDGQEKIYQTFTHEVENTDCAVDEVSVSFAGNGNIKNTTTIQSIMDIDMLCSNVVGLIGEPFDINTTSEFNQAEITFKVDPSLLGNTKLANLGIMWFDEENYVFELIDSTVDVQNGTVTAVVSHFSKYLVIDKNEWYEDWKTKIDYSSDSTKSFNMIIAIDDSGSMDFDKMTNKPVEFYNGQYGVWQKGERYTCERLLAAQRFINTMSNNDSAAIFEYTGTATEICGLTDNRGILTLALHDYQPNCVGSTNFNVAIEKALSIVRSDPTPADQNILVLLTDGQQDESGSGLFNYDLLDQAVKANLKIYTVGLGTEPDSQFLYYISHYTGGKDYYTTEAEKLMGIYAQIGCFKDIDTTDSDNDGLYDVFEYSGMKTQIGGDPIYTIVSNPDSDGDGLKDGEEIIMEYIHYNVPGMPSDIYYGTAGISFRMVSHPRKTDSDGDGLKDSVDAQPLVKFDDRFMLVNSYDFKPSNDFVDKHLAVSEKCYDKKIKWNQNLLYAKYCIYALGGYISPIQSWMLKDNIADFQSTISPKYAYFLDYYLSDTSTPLILDSVDMYSIIFGQKSNKEHYSYNINQLRDAVESILRIDNNPNNKICISTTSGNNFKCTCYKGQNCSEHSMLLYNDAIAASWGYAIGESFCAMVGEAYTYNNKYYMKVKYYLIDIYEFPVHWNEKDAKDQLNVEVHSLHECGLAKEYKIIGVFEDFVAWEKGDILYPNDYKDIKLDTADYDKDRID